MNPHRAGAQTSRPRSASLTVGLVKGQPDPLPALCAEFPDFRIWREVTGDRTQYIARSLRPGIGPHTVVTADLDEMRDVLGDAPAR